VILAQLMVDIRESVVVHGVLFTQRYSYKKGVEALGDLARKGAYVEVEQIHKRIEFEPIHVKDTTATEKQKALLGLMLIAQKEGKQVKGRLVYNGKPIRVVVKGGHFESDSVSRRIAYYFSD